MMSRFGRAAGLVVLVVSSLAANDRGDDDSPVLSAPGDRGELGGETGRSRQETGRRSGRPRTRPPVLIVPGLSRGVVSKPKTRAQVSTSTIPPLEALEPKPTISGPIRSSPRSLGAGLPAPSTRGGRGLRPVSRRGTAFKHPGPK